MMQPWWKGFGFELSTAGASKNAANEATTPRCFSSQKSGTHHPRLLSSSQVARRYTNNGHKRTVFDAVSWSDGGTPLVYAGCTPDKGAELVRKLMADEQGSPPPS